MGYTALEKMRDKNTKKYGKELGPINPSPHYCDADDGRKAAVLLMKRQNPRRIEPVFIKAGV